MKYLQSYRIWFDSPKWWQTLLAGVVCVLVPIMGPIVLLGYGFEVIESWHRGRRQGYKEFDLNQLVKYMLRGLWPFLVQLVIGLTDGLLFGMAYLIGFFSVLPPQSHRQPAPATSERSPAWRPAASWPTPGGWASRSSARRSSGR